MQTVLGGRLLQFGQPFLEQPGDLDGVRARLLADVQEHGRRVVIAGQALDLLRAVLDVPEVADGDRVAAAILDGDLLDLGHARDAAHRPQREFELTRLDGAAGHLQVLRLQGLGHVGHGQTVRAHLQPVEVYVDLPFLPADDQHLAHARERFQLPPQHLVAILRQVAGRRGRGDGNGHHGHRVGIELLHGRLLDVLGQVREDAIHLVADFLGGDVGVLLQDEGDEDLGNAFRRNRAELVDAAGGVDGLFDLVGDLGFHLFGGRARQARGHGDDGEIDLGKAVQPKVHVAHHAEHEEDQGQHRGEDGPANAERGEEIHCGASQSCRVGQDRRAVGWAE